MTSPKRPGLPQQRGAAAPDLVVADVLHGLSGLDPVASDALRLIYFRQFTQDQAARALGLPRSTVSKVVARGLRELSAYLLDAASKQGVPKP